MEKLRHKKSAVFVGAALSAAALTGCSIDSYSTDTSDVQCDGERTGTDLAVNGMATFIVHGSQESDVAMIKVRRTEEGVSVAVSGDITGPPQELESDGFTRPTPVTGGAELVAFGAGGVWEVDVREDNVVIQGTCEGI